MRARCSRICRSRGPPPWRERIGAGDDDLKRVAFCTFGCRLNQYDTETVRTLLERDGGWRTVEANDEADVYVVNTCSVTARADATCRKAIRRIHQSRPEAAIVVTGCYAQRAPHELGALPGVRLVVGAAERGSIAAEMRDLAGTEPRIVVPPIEQAREFVDVPITEMLEHSRAYVKVQEGCNEACSFCIVPQTRGRSRSREPASVLAQIEQLLASGYVEIVLTGVHLGDYGLDLAGGRRLLASLIEDILDAPGLARFRLSSIEPASVGEDLIELMAAHDKFARHLHLPLQSASDAVLGRMRRRYTAAGFAGLVRRVAERVPGCGIGTDVICGFPGESDTEFRATFDCLAGLPVTYVHAFSYSVRPGSEAAAFGDDVPGDIKKRRVAALKRLVRDKQREFRARHLGEIMPVLLERARHGGGARLGGWTDNYLRVSLADGAEAPAGGLAPVRIVDVADDGLVGELLDHA